MGPIGRLYARYFFSRRDLFLLWIGQLASGFGDSLALMGFVFLALKLTGSDRAVGFFQMIAYVPIIVFGLAAGVYVDRRNRRAVMLVADAGRALALGLIPLALLLGTLDIVWAGVTVMTVTTLTTFFNPAYNSALTIVVNDPAKLFGVNAVMSSSRQFAAIAGPAFAAFGAASSGPETLLGINALTYVISFVCIALIATPLAPSSSRARIRLAELREQIAIGLRTVMGHHGVRSVFLLTLANNLFLMGPAVVGTPLLVRNVFGGTLVDYAGIEMMYALGMAITGFVLHRVGNVRRLGMLWSLGLVLDGFTFLLYLPASELLHLYIATFIHALAIPLIIVPRTTLMQRLVPTDLLGRAFGYIDIAVLGVTAFSAGLAGLVSAEIGPRLTIVAGGVLAGVCGIVGFLVRAVRRIGVGTGSRDDT